VTARDEPPTDQDIAAALDAGDLDRALILVDRALAATRDLHRRVRLETTRGRLLAATGDSDAALAAFAAALDAAQTPEQRGQALLARAEVAEQAGAIALATADLRAVLDSSTRPALLSDPGDLAAARHLLGRIERDYGDLERAISLLRAARRQLATSAGSARYAGVTIDLAMALRIAGEARPAIELLEALLPGAGDALAARVLTQIGTTWAFLSDGPRALAAWDRALALLTDTVDRARIAYNRALVLREMGELAAACDELARARAEHADRDRTIAFDLLLLAGVVARELVDPPGALAALRDALAVAPSGDAEGRARLELGVTLAATGLFGLAVDELSAAAGLCTDPIDRGRAIRLRGLARRELGQVESAIDDLLAAAGLPGTPEDRARAAVTAATLLAVAGRRREALDVASRPLDDPSHGAGQTPIDSLVLCQLLVQRGALRSELGDLERATGDLERAARLAEEAGDTTLLASILADLGAIYTATGASRAARDAFTRAAALAASGPVARLALTNLANLLVTEGDGFAALDLFERAVAAAEDDRDARALVFLARGNAALRLGLYAASEADFARVLTLQPARALVDQASVGLRTTGAHLRHIARLRAELSAVISAADRPAFRAEPTLQRGLLAMSTGDEDAAIVDLTRAASLFPLPHERARASACLALACARSGRCADAATALRDADALDPARAWLTELAADPGWRRCPGLVTSAGC
jgi:tetratricopeptide (TPR) repeat protein